MHEEADTACVAIALQHGLAGRTALLVSEDNDVLMAALCGLSAAVHVAETESAHETESAQHGLRCRDAVRRVHLQASEQWLKPDGKRHRSPKAATPEVRRTLRKSHVIAVGSVTLDLCYGTTGMTWLPSGPGRALTLAYACSLFGGDTVEKIYGFTIRDGVAALLFMREHLALPTEGHDRETVDDSIVAASCNLLEAAMYQRHKSWFEVSGAAVDAPKWVAATQSSETAFAVYLRTRIAKDQLLSEQQTEAQAAKAGARVTEWQRAAMLQPKLITGVRDAFGRWPTHPAQLKGLVGMKNGEPTPDEPITAENAASRHGLGPDHDAMAARASTQAANPAAGSSSESAKLSNDSVRHLSDSQLENLGLKRLNLAIAERCASEGKKGIKKTAAATLRLLVARGFEPGAAPVPAPVPDAADDGAAAPAAASDQSATSADGQAQQQDQDRDQDRPDAGTQSGKRKRGEGAVEAGAVGGASRDASAGTAAQAASVDATSEGGDGGGDGDVLSVGTRVDVYWGGSQRWYTATVTSYCAESKMHSILYDDDDQALMDTSSRAAAKWRSSVTVKKARSRGRPPAKAAKGSAAAKGKGLGKGSSKKKKKTSGK